MKKILFLLALSAIARKVMGKINPTDNKPKVTL